MFVLWPRGAAACTCALGNGRPCANYWSAPVIFAGQVSDISDTPTTIGQGANQQVYRQKLVRFVVEEAFRGVSGPEAEVVTGNGGGDCGYGFAKGGRYLVYAFPGQQDKRLYTGICTPTKPLDKAAADIEYIHNLAGAPATATVYGALWQTGRDISTGKYLREPKAGVKIMIEGGGVRREAFTDAEGKFQASDLPAGRYKVKADLPDYLGGAESEVELHASGCGDVLLNATWSGQLSGRVTDDGGAPVKGLAVNLVSADAGPVEILPYDKKITAFTDADGRYEFKWLAPGNYLLVVNPEGTPGLEGKPYPRTFYPGVEPQAEAGVLAVGEGEQLKDKDLRLTRRLEEREIKGVVVWPDGRPAAAGTTVVLWDAERSWRQMGYPSQPDEQGRFTLKGYEGGSYLVTATVNLEGGRQMCGGPAEVTARGETAPVRLVIKTPYGNCLANYKKSSIKP
jgi:hypothetical protein